MIAPQFQRPKHGDAEGNAGCEKSEGARERDGKEGERAGGLNWFIIVYLMYTILTAMIHRLVHVQWGLTGL